MSAPFSIVDVFSTTPYKGNPLAVVNSLDDSLTTTQMKLITRQFNLSETTFFLRPQGQEAAYRLRSFLPDGKEVIGAGHNILGAWWYLANAGLLDWTHSRFSRPVGEAEEFVFHQELGKEVLPVKVLRRKVTGTADGIEIALRQHAPEAHGTHPDPASLAASISLGPDDIGITASGQTASILQPQVMSTSTTRHLLVPVASVAALNRARVDRDSLLKQLALVDEKAYGIYLFTPATPTQSGESRPVYQARFFSPGMSAEDPATGSAAGPLVAYLHKYGHVKLARGEAEVLVRQGQMVGRDCLIKVRISKLESEPLQVDIIGSGVGVAEGRINVPSQLTIF